MTVWTNNYAQKEKHAMTHKTVRLENDALLLVETPLGVVYIRTGLSDPDHGRHMETIVVRAVQYGVKRKQGNDNTLLIQEKDAA